jgi:hypothetical protein
MRHHKVVCVGVNNKELNVLFCSVYGMYVFQTQYCSGDEMEKIQMSGSCRTYGEGRGVYRVWWGNLRERDHLGDPDVDGMIILRWIFRK